MFVTCNCFTKSSYISFVQQLKNVLKARFLFYICPTPNAILHSQCIKQILGEELCRYLDVIHRENLNHFMNCLMFYEMFLMLIAACMDPETLSRGDPRDIQVSRRKLRHIFRNFTI